MDKTTQPVNQSSTGFGWYSRGDRTILEPLFAGFEEAGKLFIYNIKSV
jgi:hypothetical protein